jgi:hypothetical protein
MHNLYHEASAIHKQLAGNGMTQKAKAAAPPETKHAEMLKDGVSDDSEDLGETELVDSNRALEGDSSEDNDEYDYDGKILINVADDEVYEKVVINF